MLSINYRWSLQKGILLDETYQVSTWDIIRRIETAQHSNTHRLTTTTYRKLIGINWLACLLTRRSLVSQTLNFKWDFRLRCDLYCSVLQLDKWAIRMIQFSDEFWLVLNLISFASVLLSAVFWLKKIFSSPRPKSLFQSCWVFRMVRSDLPPRTDIRGVLTSNQSRIRLKSRIELDFHS